MKEQFDGGEPRARARWPVGSPVAAAACSHRAVPVGVGLRQFRQLGRQADPANVGPRRRRGLPAHAGQVVQRSPTRTLKIQLTLVPDAQVVQKYSQAASSGSRPGPGLDRDRHHGHVHADQLVPGHHVAGRTACPYKKYLSPAHLGQATCNGEINGIPFTADVSVLYYNKTLFTKAGLNPNDPPTTWAQIAV